MLRICWAVINHQIAEGSNTSSHTHRRLERKDALEIQARHSQPEMWIIEASYFEFMEACVACKPLYKEASA
jgi:hypothetical protein